MDKTIMVNLQTLSTIKYSLEKFLLKKKNFSLNGEDYDLILVTPVPSGYMEKNSWLISSSYFDGKSQLELLKELVPFLKQTLTGEQYLSVARINFYPFDSKFVESINTFFPNKNPLTQVQNFSFGDYHIDFGVLLQTNLLHLVEGREVLLQLRNGYWQQATILGVDKEFNLKYRYKAVHSDNSVDKQISLREVNTVSPVGSNIYG